MLQRLRQHHQRRLLLTVLGVMVLLSVGLLLLGHKGPSAASRVLPNFHIRLEMGSEAQGEDLQRAIDDALQGMDEGEGQRLTESATSQRLQRRVAEEEAKEDRVLIEGLKELRRLRETTHSLVRSIQVSRGLQVGEIVTGGPSDAAQESTQTPSTDVEASPETPLDPDEDSSQNTAPPPSEEWKKETRYKPWDFPVVVVAYNRPDYLRRTLLSLSKVHDVRMDLVTVYQDGDDDKVRSLVEQEFQSMGVKLVQHARLTIPRKEGADYIADMYRFTLQHVFVNNPQARYAVILEDDMLFSKDLLWYFAQTAPLLDAPPSQSPNERLRGEPAQTTLDQWTDGDPTVLAISAYNDNGFVDMVRDSDKVLRTDFFIGLGWLASRRIFMGEWEKRWPKTHWDHWVRDPAQSKGRSCVFPEVPRVYHIGREGTHAGQIDFDGLFTNIAISTTPYDPYIDVSALFKPKYDAQLKEAVLAAQSLSSVEKINEVPSGADVAIWYQGRASSDEKSWGPVAKYFGLWSSVPIRGAYQGVLQFWWNWRHIYLIGSWARPEFQPKNQQWIISPGFWLNNAPIWGHGIPAEHEWKLTIGRQGESCVTACREKGMECRAAMLARANQCALLQANFLCTTCENSEGSDQPASEVKSGRCLVNSNPAGFPFSCEARHSATSRLCPCVYAKNGKGRSSKFHVDHPPAIPL